MEALHTITVCDSGACTACMACFDSCQFGAISVEDTLEKRRAVIDPKKCVECGACRRMCPQLNPVELREPIKWWQGWATDPKERAESSSGGVATAISRAFLARGGMVCSCAQTGGSFKFLLTDMMPDIEKARGSKYVKTNPQGVFKSVRDALRAGREVLFVGLPCQVAAMRNYTGKFSERLYTVDLICHGTPSPELLSRFLGEHNKVLNEELILDFRKKAQFQLRYRGAETGMFGRIMDRYTIAFLEGMSYTDNCYSCRYAQVRRASDVTLGDSWGTELAEEKAGGVSLMLVQTEKGKQLLELADVTLSPVDERRALESNGQLSAPSKKSAGRVIFFNALAEGKTVDDAVFKAAPRTCIKRSVKSVIKSHVLDWKARGTMKS